MQGPESRESLLARLGSPQSDEGWHEFASIYRPLVYRVARAKGLQHADAEDLTQEVLAVVERSLDQFDPAIGGFRSWLYQITRNLVVNHLTRRRGPIGSGDSDVGRILSQQPAIEQKTSTLFRLEYRRSCFQHATSIVKTEFSDATWSAFWLTAVELQSVESVAMQLGKSEGAIRVARCRVLDRLRVFVSEQSGGFEPPG
ncbi:MAG: sigma-70 family RNA polymerase sigma factor [Planctomycetaceae bacterium]